MFSVQVDTNPRYQLEVPVLYHTKICRRCHSWKIDCYSGLWIIYRAPVCRATERSITEAQWHCNVWPTQQIETRNFAHLSGNGLPNSGLGEIIKCLLRFDYRATIRTLCGELFSLASQLDRLKLPEGLHCQDSHKEVRTKFVSPVKTNLCYPLSVQSPNWCLLCDWTGQQDAINTVHHTSSLWEKFLNCEIN